MTTSKNSLEENITILRNHSKGLPQGTDVMVNLLG